jgi:predicted nucleic acid-binding protein
VRFSVDTSILVYTVVSQTGARHRVALETTHRASGLDCVVTLQALGKMFRTFSGKFKVTAREATATVEQWRSAMPVVQRTSMCSVAVRQDLSSLGSRPTTLPVLNALQSQAHRSFLPIRSVPQDGRCAISPPCHRGGPNHASRLVRTAKLRSTATTRGGGSLQ